MEEPGRKRRRYVRGYGKWERWRERGANFKWLSLFSKVQLPKGVSASSVSLLFAEGFYRSSSTVSSAHTHPTVTRRFPPSNHLRHLPSSPSHDSLDVLFTNLTRLVMELFSSYFRGKSTAAFCPRIGSLSSVSLSTKTLVQPSRDNETMSSNQSVIKENYRKIN